ncbi:hypothetical protein VTL71DRAFT_15372 [Oculimacula yallundae]|uniref:DUF7587 domain-containing protein n=1 Tax=Oculimacula yallundae TaxID=86028 RepID=A0ABR4CIQ0_9HELO
MATYYNQLDLYTNRGENKRALRSKGSVETDEALAQKQLLLDQKNKDNALLNLKSRAVIDRLAERRWAQMYLLHLVSRVTQTQRVMIHFSKYLPGIEALSIDDSKDSGPIIPIIASQKPKYKESVESYLEVLEQRESDARIGMETCWLTLNTLCNALKSGLRNNVYIDIKDHPQDDDVAFRLTKSDSHSKFFADRGDIRCSNWQNFDINQRFKKGGAISHIEECHIVTDYVSISTSPGRTWNYINYINKKQEVTKTPVLPKAQVAIIDLRVLRRLGIAYGSTTTDLGFKHYNKSNDTGVKYATKHHALVIGWLPRQCILGFVSISQFENLLVQSDISSTHEEDLTLPDSEYEKKISFDAIRACLPKTAGVPLSGSGAASEFL